MKDCKKCIHYEVCREWYGNENGMPNYSEDIECKNYLTVDTDSNAEMIRRMPNPVLNTFLWWWELNAITSFLEHGGLKIMDYKQLGEWLESDNHEIIVKTLLSGKKEEE